MSNISTNECTQADSTRDAVDLDSPRHPFNCYHNIFNKLQQLDSMMFGATLWGTEIDMEKDKRDQYFMLAERLIKEVQEHVDTLYDATRTPEGRKRAEESKRRVEQIIAEREGQS